MKNNIKKIRLFSAILEDHGIPHFIENNRIIADSMLANTEPFSETVDLTDFSKNELYLWLGY